MREIQESKAIWAVSIIVAPMIHLLFAGVISVVCVIMKTQSTIPLAFIPVLLAIGAWNESRALIRILPGNFVRRSLGLIALGAIGAFLISVICWRFGWADCLPTALGTIVVLRYCMPLITRTTPCRHQR